MRPDGRPQRALASVSIANALLGWELDLDALLIVAGCLALLGSAVHGGAGEVLVVRKLSPETLPPTSFGGPVMTKTMIHVTWHMTTVAFLAVGVSLVLSGSVLDGDAAQALGLVSAVAATGFALVALAMGAAYGQFPRGLVRHPGPVLLTLVAALAWLGAL
jgi:hypothetical protein